MKVALVALIGLCAPLATSAQYFSEGWRPGQAVSRTQATTSAGFDPSNPRPTRAVGVPAGAGGAPAEDQVEQPGLIDRLVTSGSVAALFNKAGVNITERYEAAKRAQAEMWDARIPLVDDENYDTFVTHEEFESPEDEAKRVWFFIVTAQATGDPMSKYADKHFDDAFEIAQKEGDIPHVKWARINYMNVTRVTTRWNIWSAPYLVLATDRGNTLRFYRASQLRLDPESLHRFLKIEAYLQTPPWTSSFAPGGKYAWHMEQFAVYSDKIYTQTSRIPRWLFVAGTGMFGSMIIQFFHRNDAKKAEELRRQRLAKERVLAARTAAAEKADDKTKATTPVKPVATTTPTASPAKKRKGKK